MASPVNPESFGFLVTDVARLVRSEMDRRISDAGLGLTAMEARTLTHAARAGAVRQTILADRLGVDAMTLSVHLDRLEARGLVQRKPDPDDRRANHIHLTPEADALLLAMQPVGASLRVDASTGFDTDEWETFLTMLKRVRENISAVKSGNARKEEVTQ
jgi:MarR family transcriptional regulator for hemolysin